MGHLSIIVVYSVNLIHKTDSLPVQQVPFEKKNMQLVNLLKPYEIHASSYWQETPKFTLKIPHIDRLECFLLQEKLWIEVNIWSVQIANGL